MQRPFRKLLGLATGAYATRRSLAGGPGHRGPPSDHFDGEVFRNENRQATAGRTFGDFLRWQRTSHAAVWPRWVEQNMAPSLPHALQAGECAITFVNHITFLLQFRELNVLTDPVYAERASPVQFAGPRRVHAPGIAFDALPRIDLVLVSHNHYDHLDLGTLERLERVHRPLFLTGLGNAAFLQQHGLTRVREFDWWHAHQDHGYRCTYVPAQHWSGRALRGRNRTLWGGFMLEADDCAVYFAGDTGYWTHFATIRERLGAPDVALLPIGAYEPRWFMRDQHMNPADAVRAHLDLQARRSVATHFGCFQLTDEAIDAPVLALAEAREHAGIAEQEFRALRPGETWRIVAAAAATRASASA
jgi:L-ascorbate metabolism protein UlaG (beta-lactamase superfamily)